MAEDAGGKENAPGGTPGGSQDGGQGGGAGGDAGAAQETAAAIEEPPEHVGGEETQGSTPPSSEGTPAPPGEDKDDTDSATEVLEPKDDDALEDDGHEDNAPAAPAQGDAAGGEDGVTPPSTGGVTFSGTEDQDPIPPLEGTMGLPKDKTKATQWQGRAQRVPGGPKVPQEAQDYDAMTLDEVEKIVANYPLDAEKGKEAQEALAKKRLALEQRDEQTPPSWDDDSSSDVYMPKENGTRGNNKKPLGRSRSHRKHWSEMDLMDFQAKAIFQMRSFRGDLSKAIFQANAIGACLGRHQQGHISSDPLCPAKNDARRRAKFSQDKNLTQARGSGGKRVEGGGWGGGGRGGAPMALERRLRPLYEALDAGNPKIALKHAQQGLKKSPGEPQLLALKGTPSPPPPRRRRSRPVHRTLPLWPGLYPRWRAASASAGEGVRV